jgi:hypothetical protein
LPYFHAASAATPRPAPAPRARAATPSNAAAAPVAAKSVSAPRAGRRYAAMPPPRHADRWGRSPRHAAPLARCNRPRRRRLFSSIDVARCFLHRYFADIIFLSFQFRFFASFSPAPLSSFSSPGHYFGQPLRLTMMFFAIGFHAIFSAAELGWLSFSCSISIFHNIIFRHYWPPIFRQLIWLIRQIAFRCHCCLFTFLRYATFSSFYYKIQSFSIQAFIFSHIFSLHWFSAFFISVFCILS